MSENNPLKQLVDRNLSGLQWNEARKRRVLRAMDEERSNICMRKKLTCMLALAIVACLMTGMALALTLVYSERYGDAAKADALLAEKYGITAELLPFFTRSSHGDVFRYMGAAEFSGMTGDYLVDLSTGEAKWLFDGPTDAGWDAVKLTEVLRLCQTSEGSAQVRAEAQAAAAAIGLMAPEMVMPDQATLAARLTELEADDATARAQATISLQEAETLARAAIQAEYGLTAEQVQMLEFVEESTLYTMEGDTPVVKPYFGLNQRGEGWTEKDGVYIVTINAQDGSIEAIIYDNGLLGVG